MRREHTFLHEAVNAFEIRLLTSQLCFCAFDVVFRTVDLFGPRSEFQFVQSCFRGIERGLFLIPLGAILAIFEPHDGLALLHAITLFDSDPRNPPRNLRPHLRLMMRDNVARRDQNRRRRRRLHARPRGVDFNSGNRLSKCIDPEDAQDNDDDHDGCHCQSLPRGRTVSALRPVDLQFAEFVGKMIHRLHFGP